MLINKIRNISNPYRITHRLEPREFVGRDDSINKLAVILDEYKQTAKLKNIVISGEKAIGKSALLHRYKQILQDNNFAVLEMEIDIDPDKKVDEFELIKSLIDQLFLRFGKDDGSFFDSKQREIWFSLTSGSYEHEQSNPIDRQIRFATKYANRKKGYSEELSHQDLEADFEIILNELICPEAEINGLAILIDEFQEFHRNQSFLNTLRIISEKLLGLIIIGAGTPTYFNMPSLEKFLRIAITVNIENMKRNEILDMIYKPISMNAKLTKYDSEKCFDIFSIIEISRRSGGNPLHVKLLCEQMFDYFQKNQDLSKIILNREVMEQVMNRYSTLSGKSNVIRLSLQNATLDQLEAFKHLYYYEGFSIRGAIHAEIAFQSIQPEAVENAKKRIMVYFAEVKDIGLFELTNKELMFDEVFEMNIDALALVEYKFIGDAIDRLYVKYLYEDSTKTKLDHHSSKSYDDFLTGKLGRHLIKVLEMKNISRSILDENEFVHYKLNYNDSEQNADSVVEDFNKLYETKLESELKEKTKSQILSISQKHELRYPSYLAAILGYKGYYILIADVSIKGKRRLIYTFYPVVGTEDNIKEYREGIEEYDYIRFLGGSSLSDYSIEIYSLYLYWMKAEALVNIYVIDVQGEVDDMFLGVKNRQFDSALSHAERIYNLDIRLREKQIYARIESLNNYGFCLINVGELRQARELLNKIKERFTLTKINLAFIKFIEGDLRESVLILKKLSKKLPSEDKASYLHLAIKHSSMTMPNVIVEDPRTLNIVFWNLALMNAQSDVSTAVSFGFYNKVTPKGDENLVHRRVRNWIEYYNGNKLKALEESGKLLNDCPNSLYLYDDILKDIEIFRAEI